MRCIVQEDHNDIEARSCNAASTLQPIRTMPSERLSSWPEGPWSSHGLDGPSCRPVTWFQNRDRFQVGTHTPYIHTFRKKYFLENAEADGDTADTSDYGCDGQ